MGLSSALFSSVTGLDTASTAITVGAHSSIGMRGLVLFGTEEQKKRWMPQLATGEMIAAFALTEPGAGSDAAGIQTKAERDGNDWILTGNKLWITNGGIADFFTVFAKTGEKSITAFVVTRDMEGVSTGPHEDKMGLRASSTTTLRRSRTPRSSMNRGAATPTTTAAGSPPRSRRPPARTWPSCAWGRARDSFPTPPWARPGTPSPWT